MTDDGWETMAGFIEDCWGDFDDAKQQSYRVFLDRFEDRIVLAALHRLAGTGKPWLPKMPEMVGACQKIVEAEVGDTIPSWPEAYTALRRSLSIRQRYHDSYEQKEAKSVKWLEDRDHVIVARFLQACSYERLINTEIDDPEYGELRKKELETRWLAFVETAEDRLASGLALAASGGSRRKQLPTSMSAAALLAAVPKPAQLTAGSSDDDTTIAP